MTQVVSCCSRVVLALWMVFWLSVPALADESVSEMVTPETRETAELAEPFQPVAIVGATILPGTGETIRNGTLLIRAGKVAALGVGIGIPSNARIVYAVGRFVTPGFIDTHSHMGLWAWPSSNAHSDGNEMSHPITPHLKAEDAIHLEDPAFVRARAGGVTTVQIIPGSANLQGGQAAVLKLRPVNTLEAMKFKGAPRGIKMAFGENPKRVHSSRNRPPQTRMANSAVMRRAFLDAREYERKWVDYQRNAQQGTPTPRPEKDPKMETLVDVLKGQVRVHVHCYRKDDLLAMLRIADDFGFKIASFQHGLEAYKVRHDLARRKVAVATWPDWWGFKMEAWDAIPENAALLAEAGVIVSLHSDSSDSIQRMYHEAAKAVRYGMDPHDALKAITIWPAMILGVDDRVGTLEVGKDADLVILKRHPFDVYTTVETTFIDGRIVSDDLNKELQ